MKKKFMFILAMCLILPAVLLSGCFGSITVGQYVTLSNTALQNSYNHVVTGNTDLSTQQDFYFSTIETEKDYDELGNYEEEKTVTRYSRKGQGSNTVLIIEIEDTTCQKDAQNNTIANSTYIEKTKRIYTKFTEGTTTGYYCLEENYTSTRMQWLKYITITYDNQASFISAIYNLTTEIFDEMKSMHVSNSVISLTESSNTEATEKGNNAHLFVDYFETQTDTSTGVSVIQQKNYTYDYYLEDDMLSSSSAYLTIKANDVLTKEVIFSCDIEYSSNATAPTSLAEYR